MVRRSGRLAGVLAALALIGATPSPEAAPSAGLTLALNPQRVCVTQGAGFYPNFDLVISNPSGTVRKIEEIRALVRDRSGTLIERRMLWQQALGLLGDGQTVPPRGRTIVFNPFSFAADPTGRPLTVEVLVAGEKVPASATVVPQGCANRVTLHMPVAGRVLVYDGADTLSHHRRGSYDDDWSQAMGIRDNFQRFGLDLVVIDRAGRFYSGDGSRTDQWFGWGQPVRAAAAGVVAAVHDGQPDNVVIGTVDKWTDRPSRANPMSSYGNYVLIEHAPGEFTLTGHLRNGSVRVRKGQRVAAGQPVGAVGNSGASGGVHVHFERRTGWGLAGIETLPAYVSGITRLGQPARGPTAIGTGDVIISR